MKFKFLVTLIGCLIVNSLYSQNLLVNGDFETGGNNVGFNINGAGYNELTMPFSGTSVTGDYAFATNAQLFDTSFNTGGDHTTGTGRMMVFNGNQTAGNPRFWRAGANGTGACGLTAGVSYSFSYWARSVSNQVINNTTRAEISVQITNATGIVAPASGFVPYPVNGWQKFTYTFIASGPCVTIELWNNNTGAQGNDFAVDDFSLYALPNATMSGTTTVCVDTSAQVTFTGSNGTAPYTFTYTVDGGTPQTVVSNAAGIATVTDNVTDVGNVVYELVSVSYGSGANVFSQNQTVPPVTITVDGPTGAVSGDAIVCPNSAAPFITFTGANSTGPYTFTYTINGGSNQTITTTGTLDTATVSVSTGTAGDFEYELVSVEASGCTNQLTNTTATITVGPPSATITGATSVCLNAPSPNVTFTATGGAAPYTFTYSINGGTNQTVTAATGNTATVAVPTNANGTFKYSLVNVASGTTTSCSEPQTGEVIVYVGAAARVTVPPESICPANSVALTFTGTPNTTVNFTSPSGNASVVLDANGFATYSPILFVTTTFTLVNAVSSCGTLPLTGSVTVIVKPTSACPGPADAEVDIRGNVPVCNVGDCTNLTANYYAATPTTSYVSQAIPYQQQNNFTGGTIMVVNNDDVYSPVFNLPFDFSFYGVTYDQLVVGSNGLISFDTSNAGQFCPWAFNQSVPSPAFPILNAIYGVYQDTQLDPAILALDNIPDSQQNINYYVQGTTPNRVFVCNFYQLPLYQCNSALGVMTSQIVLYETTNVIDVLVNFRSGDCAWNGGNGVVGVQNASGSAGTPAPGMNTGDWNATNQAVRFYPSATSTTDLTTVAWKDASGNIISTEDTINVCPQGPETYTVEVTYTKPDGSLAVITDSITIGVEPQLPIIADPLNRTACLNTGGPYTFDLDQAALMTNNDPNLEVLYYETEQDARDYGFDIGLSDDINNYQVATEAELPKTIYVRITDLGGTSGCANYRSFTLNNFAPTGSIQYGDGTSPFCVDSSTSVPVVPSADFPFGGIFTTVPATGLTIDPNSGALDLSSPGTVPGVYDVIYTLEGGDCSDFIVQTTVTINPCIACTVDASGPAGVCLGDPINLTAVGSPIATFAWTGPDGFMSSLQNPTVTPLPTIPGDYTYQVVSTISGIDCATDTFTVTVHPIPDANFVTISQAACTNSTVLIELTGLPDAFVTYNFNENGVTGQNTIQLSSATSPAPGTASFTTAALTQDSTYELVSVSSNTTPSCNFTFAPGTSITITVGLPDGSMGVPTDPVICPADGTTIPVTGSPGATIDYTIQSASGPPDSGIVTIATDGTGVITTGTLNETTTYTLTNVTSTGTPSCSKALVGQTATVTVNPLPQVTGFTSDVASVCPNGPVMLSFTGTAGATVTFTDGTTSTNVPIDATGIGATTLNLTADTTFTITGITSGDTPSCPGTGPFPVAVTVTVDVLASVTDPSDQELCPGDTFTTFTVTGSGTNISYQWFGPSGQLTDSAHISGSTTNTLVINAPTGADAGGYYVVVSNICTNATSATAQLAVDAPIVIVAPLPTGGTICEGDTISLTANATGVALTYQWYGPSGQLSDSGNVSGSGTPTLTVSNVSLNDAGTYYCIVNNACNQPQQTQDAYFIINEKPQITQQPTTVQSDYCAGETVTIDVVATGTGLTYQWYKGSTATPVTGNATATTNQLVLTGTAVSDSGSYFVVVSGTCLPVQTSTAVTVTVKEAPSIVAQPQDVTICATETIDLSVITPSGTSFTFQWRHNGADLVGENLSTLSIPNATLADAGDYTVVVGNGGICPDIESEVAVVVVNQAPVITVQPLPLDVCVGNTIILTTDAAGNNITYQWQFNNVDIDGVVNPSALTNILEIQNADFVNAGNYTCIVSSASCPPLTTNVARVAVIALPVATIANGNEPVICAGSAADVIVSGTANAIVTYTINGGAPQTVTISPSGTAIIATGIIDATATYELLSVVRGENPPCPNSLVGGAQSVAVVTVNPLPGTELDQDGYICVDPITGATFRTYTLDTGFPNDGTYSFEWFLDTVSQPQFSNQPVIEADTVGTYMVTVTDLGSGCVQSATAPIVSSSPPLSITLEAMTSYFDENATIAVTVDPPGDYEYRINDGPYQESNVFEGVRTVLNFNDTGTHTVYVRDAKVCGEVTESITIIDYPKYFTPNGDGFHDTWNISTLRGQPNTKIYIFDRFGKLIKQISTEGLGWDGTYNGKPMLADDYWFVVKYSEAGINKEFKAHFAMKR